MNIVVRRVVWRSLVPIKTAQDVYRQLAFHKEARTPKEISEEVDPHMSQQMVSVYLNRLARAGDVVKEARGKFRRNAMGWAGRED